MPTPYNPIVPGETDTDRRERGREMVRMYNEKKKRDDRFDSTLVSPLGLKPRDKTERHEERMKAVQRETLEKMAKARALRGG